MAESTDTAENKGSKTKLIIIIGAVVLVLLIGGGVAAFLLLKSSHDTKEEDPGKDVPVPAIEQQEAATYPEVNVENFIVNIISGDAAHYVKASLTLSLTNAEAQAEAQQRMPQIRDTILLLVGNKTYEELQDLHGKEQLKAELTNALNSFFQSGKVRAIFYTNFVVQ